MPHSMPSALVLAAARAWIGTPWTPRAALRGHGCDCAGLVRGVLGDLTGVTHPAPPWDAEGASWGMAMIDGARRAGLVQVDGRAPAGSVIAWRIGRRAHVGIATASGVIHCDRPAGVVEVPAPLPHMTIAAWAIPAASGAVPSTADLGVADLLAVVYPPEGGEKHWRAPITDARTAVTLAAGPRHATKGAALDYLAPWGVPVEVAGGAD